MLFFAWPPKKLESWDKASKSNCTSHAIEQCLCYTCILVDYEVLHLCDLCARLDLPSVSPSKAIRFYEVCGYRFNWSLWLNQLVHVFPQIDGGFAVDLLAEVARAYLAATDTRSQVLQTYM